MKFKNYFGKFGIGWILVGVTSIIILIFYLFSFYWGGYFKYYEGGYTSALMNLPAWMILITITLLTIVLLPYFLGYFGLTRLFWLLFLWNLIAIVTGGWNIFGDLSGLIIAPFTFIIAIVIGVVLEIRQKRLSKL